MPAAWPAKRVAHWRLLAQARAVENQSYVVACNTGGTHAGVPMGGGRWSSTRGARCWPRPATGEEVLVVDLDLELGGRAPASSFPVLADRRL